MNLILVQAEAVSDDCTQIELRDEAAEHVRRVLRAAVGDTVRVGVVGGRTARGTIEAMTRGQVLLAPVWDAEVPPPQPGVELVLALPRPQILKHVLRVAGVVGIERLWLCGAERVEKSYFQSPLLQSERLERQLLEGMSQGLQTRMPRVEVLRQWHALWDAGPFATAATAEEWRVVADMEATARMGDGSERRPRRVLMAIGPEGGWVPEEVTALRSAGCGAVTLGRWTFRVEQAVTAALAQLEYALAQPDLRLPHKP